MSLKLNKVDLLSHFFLPLNNIYDEQKTKQRSLPDLWSREEREECVWKPDKKSLLNIRPQFPLDNILLVLLLLPNETSISKALKSCTYYNVNTKRHYAWMYISRSPLGSTIFLIGKVNVYFFCIQKWHQRCKRHTTNINDIVDLGFFMEI